MWLSFSLSNNHPAFFDLSIYSCNKSIRRTGEQAALVSTDENSISEIMFDNEWSEMKWIVILFCMISTQILELAALLTLNHDDLDNNHPKSPIFGRFRGYGQWQKELREMDGLWAK
jgi:hypothetical protein